MQKTERAAPAYSGCLARMVILLIVAVMLWCNHGFGQLTKQDSIAAGRYIDSLVRSTSMVEFKVWSDANATTKKSDFDVLQGFYMFFINSKLDAWIQQRKKNEKPKQ